TPVRTLESRRARRAPWREILHGGGPREDDGEITISSGAAGSGREGQGDARAPGAGTRDRCRAAVQLHDPPHNGQAEPGPAGMRVALAGPAEVAIEHAGEHFRRNAFARVLDRHDDGVRRAPRREPDLAA